MSSIKKIFVLFALCMMPIVSVYAIDEIDFGDDPEFGGGEEEDTGGGCFVSDLVNTYLEESCECTGNSEAYSKCLNRNKKKAYSRVARILPLLRGTSLAETAAELKQEVGLVVELLGEECQAQSEEEDDDDELGDDEEESEDKPGRDTDDRKEEGENQE